MTLEFKFDPNLDYQRDAINSVIDLFNGQIKQQQEFTFLVKPNILTLSYEDILSNVQEIRKRNGLADLGQIEFSSAENLDSILQFTIEMETGTGKTYVYLRTIFELKMKYGFTKFIIVVPSVAIKEGVLKTFEITRSHFKGLYENPPYISFVYSSGNLAEIRMFAQDTNLQIMIITRDAFNKDKNIIHNVNDRMGDKPIELIKRTNPIVILDEPHKMGGGSSEWGISELNPLLILRYSATHKEFYNLLYRLSPSDAYSEGLVKKIEVLSVTEDSDPRSKRINLEKINSISTGLRAKVKVFVKENAGIKQKSKTLKDSSDLEEVTKNPYYNGFIVSEINKGSGYLEFSNGVRIFEGKSSIDDDAVIRTMIRETIREHLDRKKKHNHLGIKALSLFFINRVDDYLPEDSVLRKTFTEEFANLIKSDFTEYKDLDPAIIHKGYFSKMRTVKSIERDQDAYNLIMKDKERLLSLDEPVEFIFSHSALREGWDNPNVFVICTLSYSFSEIKKRQEIGRGLRLPVNSSGERIHDREKNILTVITNETYRDYVEHLQAEFHEEGLEAPPTPENRAKRKTLSLTQEVFNSKIFKTLWQKISKKAKYIVDINKEEFIKNCTKAINEIEGIEDRKISIRKVKIESLGSETTIKHDGVKSKSIKQTSVFNIVNHIENETNLTRSTILEVISKVDNLELFFKNPQTYTEKVIRIIKHQLKLSSVQNIQYVELDEKFDANLFNQEIHSYEGKIATLSNQKTLYKQKDNGDSVIIYDSIIESDFAKALDRDSRIKLFLKLPDWFKLSTPAGKYNPDWAIFVEKTVDAEKFSIYFVVETKGSNDFNSLRTDEQLKITCAKKRYEIVSEVNFLAPIKDFETMEQRM